MYLWLLGLPVDSRTCSLSLASDQHGWVAADEKTGLERVEVQRILLFRKPGFESGSFKVQLVGCSDVWDPDREEYMSNWT